MACGQTIKLVCWLRQDFVVIGRVGLVSEMDYVYINLFTVNVIIAICT